MDESDGLVRMGIKCVWVEMGMTSFTINTFDRTFVVTGSSATRLFVFIFSVTLVIMIVLAANQFTLSKCKYIFGVQSKCHRYEDKKACIIILVAFSIFVFGINNIGISKEKLLN